MASPVAFLPRLYFVFTGISKIDGFDGATQRVIKRGVPLSVMLLPITSVLQIGGGAALILSWQTLTMTLMLAGMTFAINFFVLDFWNVYNGFSQAQETQNFVKKLAIMASPLALAAGPGTQALSLDGFKNIWPSRTAST